MMPKRPATPTGDGAQASLRRSAGLARRELMDLFSGRGFWGRGFVAREYLGREFLSRGKRPPSSSDAFERFFAAPTHLSSLLTIDHGLVAAGIGAAIGSATFAIYMISRDNSHPVFGGAEHLMLFAQPLGPGGRQLQIGAGRADERPVDYSATGSIRQDRREIDLGDGAAARDDAIQVGPNRAALKGFVLRFVHNGVAFVQSDHGSFVVAKGALLPGAGRVHAIEKWGDGWVVVTASGIIAE